MDHSAHMMASGMDHTMPGHTMPGHTMPGHTMPGHTMPDSGGLCSMAMTLNAQIDGVCILTQSWRTNGGWSMLRACIVVAFAAVAFEWIREMTRRFELGAMSTSVRLPSSRSASPVPSSDVAMRASTRKRRHLIRTALYAVQVAISFTLMLVFMTFNIYVMAAVVVGSAMGFYFFNTDPAGVSGKTMVCH
ncbi:copper transpport protein [Savitreella phatthalungensis]